MKSDFLKKGAALSVGGGFLVALPFSAVLPSAESQLAVHHTVLSSQDVVNDYVLEKTSDDEMLQAAAEKLDSPRTKRQSSRARGKASSTGLLSMLSGSGHKHFAYAFFVAALSAILLRGGSVPEGSSKDMRPKAAPVAALPGSLFSNKLLVGFLAVLLLASSLAASQGPTADPKPPVKTEEDAKGNEVTVIGQGWRDADGYLKQGTQSVSLRFDGRRYKLFLPRTTEEDLRDGGKLDELKKMLQKDAELRVIDGKFHFLWGWQEGAKLFYDTGPGPVFDFFLLPETEECLYCGTKAARSFDDLISVLDVFVKEASATLDMIGMPKDGGEKALPQPPLETLENSEGGKSFVVGRGWTGNQTETMVWNGTQHHARICKDSQTRLHLPVGAKTYLEVVLSKDADMAMESAIKGRLAKELEKAFDNLDPYKPRLRLEEVLNRTLTGDFRNASAAVPDLEDLFYHAQSVARGLRLFELGEWERDGESESDVH